MSKILNEILINWGENQDKELNKPVNAPGILQSTDINKALDSGCKSRLTELGSNLVGLADMLLVYGVNGGNDSFKNYAWFRDERMWCYTPMKSGLNFLSPEALKCIDWIEIKGGDDGRKCIHIDYLGYSPDSPNLFSFSGVSANGDKIKWFVQRGTLKAIEKLWFPCMFNFETNEDPYFKKFPASLGTMPVFPMKPIPDLISCCGSFNDIWNELPNANPNMWFRRNRFIPGIDNEDCAIIITVKFKGNYWNLIAESGKMPGGYWQGPRGIYFNSSVKEIPDGAFKNWDILTNIACSHKMSYIGTKAFERCWMSCLDFGKTELTAFAPEALSGIVPIWEAGEVLWIFSNTLYKDFTDNKTFKSAQRQLFGRKRPTLYFINSSGNIAGPLKYG